MGGRLDQGVGASKRGGLETPLQTMFTSHVHIIFPVPEFSHNLYIKILSKYLYIKKSPLTSGN